MQPLVSLLCRRRIFSQLAWLTNGSVCHLDLVAKGGLRGGNLERKLEQGGDQKREEKSEVKKVR